MLIGQTAEWVEIPHEPGNYLSLAVQTWRQLKEARAGKTVEAAESMRALGPELINALPKGGGDADRLVAQALADPLDSYSFESLLRSGVRGWRGPLYDGHEFDLDALDERTAQWAVRTVFAMSRIEDGDAGKYRASSGAITEEVPLIQAG